MFSFGSLVRFLLRRVIINLQTIEIRQRRIFKRTTKHVYQLSHGRSPVQWTGDNFAEIEIAVETLDPQTEHACTPPLRRRTTDVFDTRWCFSDQWTAIFKRKPRLFGSSVLCHLRNTKLARAESKERGKRSTRVERWNRTRDIPLKKDVESWQSFSTMNRKILPLHSPLLLVILYNLA